MERMRATGTSIVALAGWMVVGTASGQITHTVEVRNSFFSPSTVFVEPGDTVRFMWIQGVHTATSGTPCTMDNVYFNRNMNQQNQIFDFPAPIGPPEIPFFCRFHCPTGMSGNIIILPIITAARSVLDHNGLDLAIDLVASAGIEARRGGASRLEFDISTEVNPDTVSCTNLAFDCVAGNIVCQQVTLGGADRTIMVELAAGMSDGNCCTFAFDGMINNTGWPIHDTFRVASLAGDVDYAGAVTGGDVAVLKPHLGEIAGVNLADPKFDFDRSGAVTGGDVALIKPLLGDIAQTCPF